MSEKGRNIILRLGSRSIECGVEGSREPLTIYNVHHFAEDQKLQISSNPELTDELSNFKSLFYPNILVYQDEETFRKSLQNHLRKLLTKVFCKSGISTINAKLLLISNNTTSEYYIELISQLLINHFMMRAVVVLSTPLMASIASGSSSATVVDFGWNFVNINVIFDNRVLQNYSKFTTRGGRRLHYDLINRMKKSNFDTKLVSFKDVEIAIASMGNACDDLERTVVCGPYNVTRRLILETITDLIVESSEFFDDDEKSPVQLIVELIERDLPIDLKSVLSDRVIFTGGLFKIEAVKQILIEKLNSSSRFKFKTVHCLGPYAGASLYSTLSKQLRKNQNLWEYRK